MIKKKRKNESKKAKEKWNCILHTLGKRTKEKDMPQLLVRLVNNDDLIMDLKQNNRRAKKISCAEIKQIETSEWQKERGDRECRKANEALWKYDGTENGNGTTIIVEERMLSTCTEFENINFVNEQIREGKSRENEQRNLIPRFKPQPLYSYTYIPWNVRIKHCQCHNISSTIQRICQFIYSISFFSSLFSYKDFPNHHVSFDDFFISSTGFDLFCQWKNVKR